MGMSPAEGHPPLPAAYSVASFLHPQSQSSEESDSRSCDSAGLPWSGKPGADVASSGHFLPSPKATPRTILRQTHL